MARHFRVAHETLRSHEASSRALADMSHYGEGLMHLNGISLHVHIADASDAS